MTRPLVKFLPLMIGGLGGIAVTAAAFLLWTPAPAPESKTAEKEPLYWVAPMDPNFKSDKPGKSPMGMDLIPVYPESEGSATSPGTVRISPEVVNNLGVRTALATRRALHPVVETVGYVQYDQDQMIHIHPRVDGWIEKLYVKAEGDPVQKGQKLYDLYSPELVNAQVEFVLALTQQNTRLIRAAEDRLTSLRMPLATIARLKKSRQVQQNITFYAPQDGVVNGLNIREGFFVKPGTTLMSIVALDQVWVEAEVFERQAPWIARDLPVSLQLSYFPGQLWTGKVDYIYPTLNPTTRTLKLRLRFDNSDRMLKPDMYANVTIDIPSPEERLLIPEDAVIRSGESDRVVLALGEGRFKSVAVTTGRRDRRYVEILTGIETGDSVVTSAQFLLDSESGKTSDFQRMAAPDADHGQMDQSEVDHSKMNHSKRDDTND